MNRRNQGARGRDSEAETKPEIPTRPAGLVSVKFVEDVHENFGGDMIVIAKAGDVKSLPSAYAAYFIRKNKAEEE